MTYQYCHVCDYCIPRTNIYGGYYGLVVITPRPTPPSRRSVRSVRRHADTSSFNITNTQTYLYCHVAIIIDIIDNITDIIALPGWQYVLMPMPLLPMHRYIYITVSVVLLISVIISLTCRHRLTCIAVSVVLLIIYHRRADIGPTYMVILLILVTISVIIKASDNVTETAIWSQHKLPCLYYLLIPVTTATRQHILTLLDHVTCEPSYCWYVLLTKNAILFI